MESGGKLPAAEEIRYATICGSRANMAARAIFHGGLGLADLSLHEIPGEWRKAIADGCDWKVIKAVVWKEFPQLLDLVRQSGNTNQSISKQEDELQLINKVKQAITSWPGASAPKWQDVSATVTKVRPLRSVHLRLCSEIWWLQQDVGGHTSLGRELGQETWAILSQEMKSFPDHLRWRHALLKYAYSGVMPITATDAAGKHFIFISSRCCQCPCRLGMLLACSFLFKT